VCVAVALCFPTPLIDIDYLLNNRWKRVMCI
jgi:hypothetical protein